MGEGLTQSSILVVEDEILIRLHLAEELRAAGYAVVEAADSREAMTVLTSRDDIGLVLTDIRMPGSIDGVALGRWIRTRFPEIKIVLVSAEFYSGNFKEFDGGFTKPVRIDDLLRRVRQLLPQAEHGGSRGR
ncbi:response regulator [Hyphomicrobium facile]|uniref:Response regulator receiver domain-containing protein n=1 Tax=Hyphomicrobium facile TaxID=51670 RepID=A0A1I7NK41_9HYPH|nr:response regulator [Hyphomicrobium facile]SFV35041.1 Response regulator receiver domain-containing protein [Hyphomicrobium facile]